jgi:urease gamma subunit
MKLNQDEAYFILTNLDMFVNRFEATTSKKVTPGALQIIQEILTEASFPGGAGARNLH